MNKVTTEEVNSPCKVPQAGDLIKYFGTGEVYIVSNALRNDPKFRRVVCLSDGYECSVYANEPYDGLWTLVKGKVTLEPQS